MGGMKGEGGSGRSKEGDAEGGERSGSNEARWDVFLARKTVLPTFLAQVLALPQSIYS